MIILKDKGNKKVVELFDTAKEFKEYVITQLEGVDKDLIKDGELPLYDNGTQPKDVDFCTNLEMFCDIHNVTIEFI